MFSNRIRHVIIRVIEKQVIAVCDVRDLQALTEEGGFITREEAEALFRAERMVPVSCDSWGEFFVEALVAHLVWERRPTGRITGDDVDWLIAQAALPRNGACERLGQLLLSLVQNSVESDERLLSLLLAENAALGARLSGLAGERLRDVA
jgi:hypothetical protein